VLVEVLELKQELVAEEEVDFESEEKSKKLKLMCKNCQLEEGFIFTFLSHILQRACFQFRSKINPLMFKVP